MKYAVIDIGSNSVRLLLWADGHTLYKKINTTRLGEGLSRTGVISGQAAARTVDAIAAFCAQAKSEGEERTFAFATAAVRSAKNGQAFVSDVLSRCGLAVDVLSGEREARAGLLGALEGKDGGIVDVGGASSEVTVSLGGKVVYSYSLGLGAVLLKDLCGEDPAALARVIGERVEEYGEVPRAEMTAVGGTATSLAALARGIQPYDPAKVHGTFLTAEEIEGWGGRLLGMTQSERLALKGMDPARADILGGGALLLGGILRKIGARGVRVSERDNMEGYLLLSEEER